MKSFDRLSLPFLQLGNRTTNYLLFSDLAHITDAPINGYPYPPRPGMGGAGVGHGWGMGGTGVGQGWGMGGAWVGQGWGMGGAWVGHGWDRGGAGVGQGWGFDTSHFQWPHTG